MKKAIFIALLLPAFSALAQQQPVEIMAPAAALEKLEVKPAVGAEEKAVANSKFEEQLPKKKLQDKRLPVQQKEVKTPQQQPAREEKKSRERI